MCSWSSEASNNISANLSSSRQVLAHSAVKLQRFCLLHAFRLCTCTWENVLLQCHLRTIIMLHMHFSAVCLFIFIASILTGRGSCNANCFAANSLMYHVLYS